MLTSLSKLLQNPECSTKLQDAGQVSCGFPSPALDHAKPELSLDDLVGLSPTSSLFLMRAWGDSMRDDGIFDGDVLVVDKAREAKTDDIVVAIIGADFVAKKMGFMDDGSPALMPSNSKYKPIKIDEEIGIEIWGVCIWNLHRLVG